MSNRINKLRKSVVVTVSVLMAGLLVFASCGQGTSAGSGAGPGQSLESVINDTSKALVSGTLSPANASVGGDWLVKGLVLADAEVPEGYYDIYYDNVRAAVKSSKGVLSEDRYTEYMRTIIGLKSINKDPRNVEGYDLTPYLDDYEKVSYQGVNAECYAIIAADLCGIELKNKERYIKDILAEFEDEAMKSDKSYADYLAIAMEAFSLCDGEKAAGFIESGMEKLSGLQKEDGSFGSAEATAECIIAITQNGVDPRDDERFKKNGKDPFDGLLKYYAGNGKFKHLTKDEDANSMAGEKALLAMDALKLFGEGKKIYE